MLKNKSVLLGVTGGVAAYKAVDLARRLRDAEASVTIMMTEASQRFITPLSLETASQNRVYSSLFDDPLAHIRLPAEADLVIIAPATANSLAKFAHGIADDLVSTCVLAATGKKIIIAPAMNWRMYESPACRRNLEILRSDGMIQVGPESGSLACGEEGIGRMSEVSEIIEAAVAALCPKDLAGETVVVTAGPTREYIDPVRFISNRSSGKMGFALARAARNRGASVTLIAGPTALAAPSGITCIRTETAKEMLQAVKGQVNAGATILVMAAAVADFSPANRSNTKIEKKDLATLALDRTDDIITAVASAGRKPFIVGFAAETGMNLDRAARKMKDKGMDMVVFNDVSAEGCGFDVDTNRVIFLDRAGKKELELMSKYDVADALFNRLLQIKA
ncbi:MAG: bifunctional phosphopantothenoylcysteine decarboxylase/phosphopantothenate--cysteine ligase CoaBC [Thermodesulfovibrio sp.]|nr:bifunctional phosphopantothenoylcysteine decarboxylase/phosphopantothenate--cysteine ligase CoaBC [Thermodesulfovibrio sp.]